MTTWRVSPGRWGALLASNGLDSFDAIWALERTWIDAPNERRGGWSGVGVVELRDASGEIIRTYLKRQQNYGKRSLLRPLRGAPMARREANFLDRFRMSHLGTPEPIVFGERALSSDRQVILMTASLDDFVALDVALAAPSLCWAERHRKINAVALAVRAMHDAGFTHRSLFPKHIFVKPGTGDTDVRFLDLEKTQRSLWRTRAMVRDLDQLSRRATGVSGADRLRFLRAYLGTDRPWRPAWTRIASKGRKRIEIERPGAPQA